MRYSLLVLIILLFTAVLDASYIRSIRLGSFPTQEIADKSLSQLEIFVLNHSNIIDLEVENEFEFKSRRSGNYYITLVEPFTKREVLQEVLDTLRLEYPGIYVTKLKSMPAFSEDVIIDSKPSYVERLHLEEQLNIKKEIDNALELEKTLKINEQEKAAKINENNAMHQSKSNYNYVYFTLLLLLAVVFFILIKKLLIYKKENESYINKEMISEEKYNQLNLELERKEKLLCHVSHELRSPVTAIMGLTHLVLENELSKSQKDYVSKIENSSEYLLGLLNNLLDVSKMHAGELKIEKSEFNLDDVISYVLSVNSIEAKKNNVHLSIDSAKDVPSSIIGDSLRLGQVLVNIMGNAIKFTKNGEITLGIKNIESYANSLKLQFSVSDNGIGMSESQVDNIFKSFYQADDFTSRKFGGTGLGLAISKQLVEMMNGEIRVQSRKKIGTTFTFTIQVHLKDSTNKRQYRLPSKKFLNKNILIVDSSNKNVIPLIKSLGYFQYKTSSISSFEHDIVDNDEYDIVIISNTKLSKLALHKLSEMKKEFSTKIVVLNELYGGVKSDNIENFKIDAFLNIPCTQQSVLNILMELYSEKKPLINENSIHKNNKFNSMNGKKMLVVEDNELNHKVIAGLLSKTGIEATFVNDGIEAVELIKKNIPFNIVLMDINMPGMNGYDATREIRKDEAYNKIPIVALTADVMDESISEAYACGMQGHIAKPIIVDIFYKKIIDILSNTVSFTVNDRVNEISTSRRDEMVELSIGIGLNRCNNDIEFYKSILRDFKNMYKKSFQTIESLCEKNNFKQARQMSMDIKDISLNIGAYNLCESAATMEYELEKGKRSDWREFLTQYSTTLEKLLLEIEKYLATH